MKYTKENIDLLNYLLKEISDGINISLDQAWEKMDDYFLSNDKNDLKKVFQFRGQATGLKTMALALIVEMLEEAERKLPVREQGLNNNVKLSTESVTRQ